ncbi:MAG: hypothetical protein IT380_24310 [Myxococcales bacterium]|nr:hypothetical protein [Myxococcales bacterium]
MYDALQRAAPLDSHRKVKKHSNAQFSPSWGVHKGLIGDPNWPPAQFPEAGTAAARRSRRIACDFLVGAGDAQLQVHGDISRGGAMFVLTQRLPVSAVVVSYRGLAASAEVISHTTRGAQTAHHVRFVSSAEALPLAQAVEADAAR